MRAFTLATVLLIAAGCGSSPPDAPPTMTGSWEGEGGQWDDGNRDREPDGRWPLEITLTRSASGDLAGAIDYPSLECGGRLEYVGPSTEPDAIPGDAIFREEITYGDDVCFTGGTVLLRLDGRSLVYAWAIDSSPAVAAARLQRAE